MMVCLDSNIVIYYVEGDPVWKPKVDTRFKAVAVAGDTLAASDAARLECLVAPFHAADVAVLADYQKFFVSPHVHMLPVTVAVWERVARIRAEYRFHALDSIHLASAIEHGCGLFLTNDARLSLCSDIAVEILT